jgi:hypothetical protein
LLGQVCLEGRLVGFVGPFDQGAVDAHFRDFAILHVLEELAEFDLGAYYGRRLEETPEEDDDGAGCHPKYDIFNRFDFFCGHGVILFSTILTFFAAFVKKIPRKNKFIWHFSGFSPFLYGEKQTNGGVPWGFSAPV